MRLCWLTDIHLNFLKEPGQLAFAREVRDAAPDAVLITGDISEAPSVVDTVGMLARETEAEIYYVLGNHDFYRGSIDKVRERCRRSKAGTYLQGRSAVELGDGVGLVGVDGWGDGRFGRPRESDLLFTDWYLIRDFGAVSAIRNVDERLRLVGEQGAECAACLLESLDDAAQRFDHVLILTHVPPFAEAAGQNGSATAELWIPWLGCQATGEVIAQVADGYPDVTFEVLCGHIHVERVTHPLPNVVVSSGAATYRAPAIQRVWDV